MAETKDRILPVGIQSFEGIRKGGYIYIDKTDIGCNRGRGGTFPLPIRLSHHQGL